MSRPGGRSCPHSFQAKGTVMLRLGGGSSAANDLIQVQGKTDLCDAAGPARRFKSRTNPSIVRSGNLSREDEPNPVSHGSVV